MNQDTPVAGIISYAVDFLLHTIGEEANDVWKQTVNASSKKGLKIDQDNWSYTGGQDTEWHHEAVSQRKDMVVPGADIERKCIERDEPA